MSENYVKKTYNDGDKDIYLPEWRKILHKENANFEAMNLSVEIDKYMFIGENEIALKHPQTGATFKLSDDGGIELFVNEDTGMRFDPRDNSIVFYGDSVHFASKETRIHTKPHGLIWNNHNVNPYLYYGDKQDGERSIPKVKMQNAVRETEAPLFQEQRRKHYYDDKVNSLIEELGLETPRMARGGGRNK